MRRHLLAAGIAAAALIPSLALAAPTCEEQHNTRVAGTLAGAGVGALIGSAVAGHDNRGTGAVIGAVGGAIAGNQIAKSNADCAHAYGYYDNNGRWNANSTNREQAQGYYDRDGAWVYGAPNGYYGNDGRWVAGGSSQAVNGYYDSNGRWNAGAVTGHYDNRGRWISGAAMGHRTADGTWVADAQPGHYDANGRWRAGQTTGYYDSTGHWTVTAISAKQFGSDSSYQGRGNWSGAPLDIRSRQTWLRERIERGQRDGSLSRSEARRAQVTLSQIVRQESTMRHYRGQLSARDEARIQGRLDTLSQSIRWSRSN